MASMIWAIGLVGEWAGAGAGGLRNPAGWTIAHMILLGWVTMLAMGASFQLVQVILLAPLFSKRLGYVQYGVYVAGLLCLLPSFARGWIVGIAVGGSLVAAAMVLFAINMAVTLWRKKVWNVFALGISLSLLGLLAAAGAGLGMGYAMGTGHGIGGYDKLFASHLWLALGGWMSGLILTYSFKLLPMFYLSQQKADRQCVYVVSLFQAGIWLRVAGIWIGGTAAVLNVVSAMLLIAAVILLYRFVYLVRTQAKPLEGTVPIAARLLLGVAAVFAVWLAAQLSGIGVAGGAPLDRTTTAFVVWIIEGWFSASILAYMARILPFLWWAYRFHNGWKKKSRILLGNMVAQDKLKRGLIVYLAGVGAVVLAFAFAIPGLAVAGQVIAALSVAYYLWELAKALRY
jgi:hypothetical protein